MHGTRGLVVGALVCGIGCSSVPETPASQQLEIFSWWTSAGEMGALTASIEAFKAEHPAAVVSLSSIVGSASAKEQLRVRFEKGAPPDVFLANGGRDLCSWVAPSPSFIQNIDSVAARQTWANPAVLPQGVQDLVRCMGADQVQHFCGVPVGIHRNNSLFYNRSVFKSSSITAPPKTVDELLRIAERLKAANIVPLALGTNRAKGGTWPLSLLVFETLLPAMLGPDYYAAFFSGHGNPEGPELRAVLMTAAHLLDYVNPNFRDLGWDEAAELVRSGGAAMTVMGDWAKGDYVADGWLAADENGFGGRAAFGSAFVVTVDTLALASGAQNPQRGIEFLEMLGSVAGQDVFNVAKGSIPPRIGELDRETYDTYSQQTAVDFATSVAATTPTAKLVPSLSHLVPREFTKALEVQLELFQIDRNVDNLILTIRNNYNKLQGL